MNLQFMFCFILRMYLNGDGKPGGFVSSLFFIVSVFVCLF